MNGKVAVVNNFASYRRKMRAHLLLNLDQAAHHLGDAIRDSISTPGYNPVATPPGVVVVGRGPRTINHRRSRPFQPPFEQTGALHDSIGVKLMKAALEARVGSNSKYMLALEFGRPEIGLLPRPYMRRGLWQQRRNLAVLMLQPL